MSRVSGRGYATAGRAPGPGAPDIARQLITCCSAASRSFRSYRSWLSPECMSAAPLSAGTPCSIALQSLLVNAHCLPETTLGNPEVRQGDGASHHVGNMPCLGETGHALGVPTVRGIQVLTSVSADSAPRVRRSLSLGRATRSRRRLGTWSLVSSSGPAMTTSIRSSLACRRQAFHRTRSSLLRDAGIGTTTLSLFSVQRVDPEH
jgi:hypothetical protein